LTTSRAPSASEAATTATRRVVRVLPDEPAIGKTFDYLVPDGVGDQVRVGTRVRIALGPRRVGGWIVATDVDAPPGVELRRLAKLSGWGPPRELVELAEWAAWRWAGRPASFLRTASPERNVMSLPSPQQSHVHTAPTSDVNISDAFTRRAAVLRRAPATDPADVAIEAARLGNALVLCPTVEAARSIGTSLRRAGVAVASHPRDWAQGAAGATVVGTRSAAWAPVADLAAIVVVDEHDEAHAQEQAPTWNARDVALERARRAEVPCVLVSPCPSLEAISAADLLEPSRNEERSGWPIVDVVDRRDDDPRTGLFSEKLTGLLRSDRRVVCVLNRTGRARLLACAACGELARCERCDAAVTQPAEGQLVCPRCDETRPVVCLACGATRLKLLRQGVSRVREELEALVGEPVGEATAEVTGASERVIVGTEAVLHQVHEADIVAFLDLDQELLAPRYRAVEQAMALVARGARLAGGKAGGGRLVLQTRLPRHEVVLAALHGDPTRVEAAEAERRELLRFPPTTAVAEVSGAAAGAYVSAVSGQLGIEVVGPADGRWLVRAPDHRILCDALAAPPRPPGRLRLSVDPLRV
jgi:primosomal protein N' (replication factor Y) (superfamily II helicase)